MIIAFTFIHPVEVITTIHKCRTITMTYILKFKFEVAWIGY